MFGTFGGGLGCNAPITLRRIYDFYRLGGWMRERVGWEVGECGGESICEPGDEGGVGYVGKRDGD